MGGISFFSEADFPLDEYLRLTGNSKEDVALFVLKESDLPIFETVQSLDIQRVMYSRGLGAISSEATVDVLGFESVFIECSMRFTVLNDSPLPLERFSDGYADLKEFLGVDNFAAGDSLQISCSFEHTRIDRHYTEYVFGTDVIDFKSFGLPKYRLEQVPFPDKQGYYPMLSYCKAVIAISHRAGGTGAEKEFIMTQDYSRNTFIMHNYVYDVPINQVHDFYQPQRGTDSIQTHDYYDGYIDLFFEGSTRSQDLLVKNIVDDSVEIEHVPELAEDINAQMPHFYIDDLFPMCDLIEGQLLDYAYYCGHVGMSYEVFSTLFNEVGIGSIRDYYKYEPLLLTIVALGDVFLAVLVLFLARRKWAPDN